MLREIRATFPSCLSSRFALLFVLVLILCIGCTNVIEEEPEPQLPAVPLVYVTPKIGDEIELRDPVPEPTRMWLDEESVEGWLAPQEGVLRFPVRLRESARLSFRIGAVSDRPETFTACVEYHTDNPPTPAPGEEPPSPVVFEISGVDTVQCFMGWLAVDVSLDQFAPSEGEIYFIAEGFQGNPDEVEVLWGQPAIYHPPERRFRNVLFIGVDTLRADALSIYGGRPEVTPNLEAYSETATVFTQARSQSSWTLPSFASMITGRLPSTIGATVYTGHLPDRATTLAELLRPCGYATEIMCTNAWLGNEQSGFEQGMDALWFRNDPPAQVAVHRAYDFISRSMGRDWFCFLHLMDPHAPFHPPRELIDRLGDPAIEGPYGNFFNAIDRWKSLETPPPENEIRQVKNLYDAEVANVDAALKDLFEFLEVNGLAETTLVIFASDHGEEFFEHGGFEHGHTQYDELVWMPLIIRGDGFPAGEAIDASVGNTDLVPTVLRYVGYPIPEGLQGVPLQDVVSGNVTDIGFVFGEGNTRGTHKKFVVEWPYKCVLDYVMGQAQLYDLDADPGETADVRELNTDVTMRLAEAIAGTMLPDQTAFHVWITVSHNETPRRFTGTLRVPGGIESVQDFLLARDDHFAIEGETLTFDLSSRNDNLGLYRHLLIIPAEDAETLEATVRVNGAIDPMRFFPYGLRIPEPSGSATVQIDDFPLGPDLPQALEKLPAACYIWGVRGYASEVTRVEHDPITLEQLRALGYAAQ